MRPLVYSASGRHLGATDAAKLLGVSKYGTILDTYLRLVEGRQTPTNAAMRRGTLMEPVVRARYVEEYGAPLRTWDDAPFRPVVLRHPTIAWATCSPDDVTEAGTLVEYKTASRWAKGWDPVPLDYVLQVLWGLWVTGLPRAHIYAAFGHDVRDEGAPLPFAIEECRLFVFERDAEMEAQFEEAGAAFWANHVMKRVPPESSNEEAAHG